ncbi:MAG: electron transfer flavoprotein subunit beta/FixA family protein [Pseudomonadota bacterium]|nr:electron transfer flavoprotein subunit beta/FixA family protein [Pseudomonadota bacterium]
MKILVPIKQVVTLDEDFEFTPDNRDVDHDFHIYDLNEWDDYSLEEALLIKESNDSPIEIIVCTVGNEYADESLRKCLAKGADRAIRVWSNELKNTDSIGIARIIAHIARREEPQLILTGVQSSDFAHSTTGVATAGILGWPYAAVVNRFEPDHDFTKASILRELEGGLEEAMNIDLPAVITIQVGINKPRYASLRGIKQAQSIPIEEATPDSLGMIDSEIGESGSASIIKKMFIPEKLSTAIIIEGTPAQQASKLAKIINDFKGV